MKPSRSIIEAIKRFDFNSLGQLDLANDLKEATCLHWQGKYKTSETAYASVNYSKLTSFELALFYSDQNLLYAKIGKEVTQDHLNIISKYKICQVLHYYASYTSWFWRDHKIANKFLLKLAALSIKMFWKDLFLMCGFLAGHMLTIRGFTNIGYYISGATSFLIRKSPYFCSRIVFAAFPYTHVVSARFGRGFLKSVELAKKEMPKEPYYQALFTVSSLYGYAYQGNFTKAELLAFELQKSHSTGKLLRYKPMSQIMPLVPLAIKGYAVAVESNFADILCSFNESENSQLINSQFYRAASIISLNLSKYENAKNYIEKAIQFREQTNSFHAWSSFDKKISELINHKQFYTPFERNEFAGSLLTRISCIYTKYLDKPDSEISPIISEAIAHHLSISEINQESMKQLGDEQVLSIDIFGVELTYLVPIERREFIEAQLSVLKPILTMISKEKQKQLRSVELMMAKKIRDRTLGRIHDIKSAIAPLGLLGDLMEEKQNPHSKTIQTVIERVMLQCREFASDIQIKNDPSSVYHLVDIASLIVECHQHFHKTLQAKNISLDFEENIDLSILYLPLTKSEVMIIVNNLIQNAIEASFSGQIVTCKIKIIEDSLEFDIADQGKGISKKDLGRVTDIGVSIDKVGGTGIGLFHVNEAIKNVGGKFLILSHLGYGTNVKINIPYSISAFH